MKYRGTDWMPEPCRSCERRELDWGGCRCQAFALTGDAANTDPACALSPEHSCLRSRIESQAEARVRLSQFANALSPSHVASSAGAPPREKEPVQ